MVLQSCQLIYSWSGNRGLIFVRYFLIIHHNKSNRLIPLVGGKAVVYCSLDTSDHYKFHKINFNSFVPNKTQNFGDMSEENMMINDMFIQILSGLIIAAIVGFATFTFVLYKCIHRQARKINRINKAFVVVLKLLVIDTRKHHPESEFITEIDKIYKEIVEDSD